MQKYWLVIIIVTPVNRYTLPRVTLLIGLRWVRNVAWEENVVVHFPHVEKCLPAFLRKRRITSLNAMKSVTNILRSLILNVPFRFQCLSKQERNS